MKITDIADEILRELGSPSSLSVAAVAHWLRVNIGHLNVLLNLSVVVSEDFELDPSLSEEEKVIFQKVYAVKYYERSIRESLGAGSFDWVEITEGDTRVRRANRNETAKTYIGLYKEQKGELDELVAKYRANEATPEQVTDVQHQFDEVWS